MLQIHFKATNNVAEYEALLHGLHIAKELGVQRVLCYGDSDLVAQQIRGTWDAKSATMAAYRAAVDEFAKCFLGYEVRHIPRAENEAADTLARLGSERKKVPKDVFLEHLHKPSIKGADLLDSEAAEPVEEASYSVYLVKPDWTTPYLDFLVNQELPEDEVLKRQIIRRAKAFTIIKGELYKRSTTG